MQNISFSLRAWLAFIVLAILNLGTAVAAVAGAGTAVVWVIAGIGAVLAVGGGGWWVSRAQSGLDKVEGGLKQIEEGNFKISLNPESADEFAPLIASVQKLAGSLRTIVNDVMQSANGISSQAQHMDKAAEHLSEQTARQSDQAMRVSATTQEMSASVAEINRATQETATSANNTRQIIIQNEANMAASLDSTQRIVEVVGEARATLNDLNTAVERIGSMTTVIKEIADQTNLLALNAAIEAARAGEAGRGFAVVADEVRKLAERTTSSTLDITNNVTNIRLVTQATLMTMESAAEEVERGTASIEASNQSLKEVLLAAETTVTMTGRIADALRQQSSSSDEVSKTITQMTGLIAANNQDAREVAGSAEQLAMTAVKLKEVVKHFERSF